MQPLPEELAQRAAQEAQSMYAYILHSGEPFKNIGMDLAYRQALESALKERLTQNTAPVKDGRTVSWKTRIRLYREGATDPHADTEPEAPGDADGTWIIEGLPGVAKALEETVVGYHYPALPAGLDRDTLARGIRGLRPTLSRHGGWGTWRVPYEVGDAAWLARVDVRKVD